MSTLFEFREINFEDLSTDDLRALKINGYSTPDYLKSMIGRRVDVTIYDYGCSGTWTACDGYQATIVSFSFGPEEDDEGGWYSALFVNMDNGRRALWRDVDVLETAV